ncbi:hypothetical protein B0O99DRAFT_604958 [Bisporella sp. PMI_857]|nr:hypothetical protein B0O99DRAFT_604958 [Bisporella sp. PMI_857]
MEALSPRDANAHIKVKQPSSKQLTSKTKPPAKLSQKEKDHPPPPPPEVIEPPSSDRGDGAVYQTGNCLGKGGFAICYEGQLAGTRQKYALKIVKSHMPQKKMEQKFQTELQIHSKMNHANIVRFHRAFSFEKSTFIVLELCPNGSLMDMVKKRKYITEPEVRYWTVQMAGAIKYMHSKGIIHRDLKMGNIFLDRDMNVKIGDFGLAALLMSGKDMNACRRTTLCGTPNYIAPEILEKGKGGHDHMVDIWSLGIIIFAMLTGKPPFQSTTADEIYRRAREREYDWPSLQASENFISAETKELVSALLQSPDQRPDPDAIVQHPFFVCGWMPQAEEMTPELRDQQPNPTQFLSVGNRSGKSNLYMKNLKKLCMKCEVGPWHVPQKQKSTYREVAAEEQAGLTPQVPLPEDVVYRPYHEILLEEKMKMQQADEGATGSKVDPVNSVASLNIPARINTQSYAAQQRARPQSSTQPGWLGSLQPRHTNTENQLPTTSTNTTGSSSSSARLPLTSMPKRPISTSRRHEPKIESRVAEKIADVEGRLAADMAEQLNKADAERKSREAQPVARKVVSLFSSREKVEAVPGTQPDDILQGLRRLQTELERALNSRSIAIESKLPPANFPIVVKWVDYTNKFGLGYILGNGSIGCILRTLPADPLDASKGVNPPSCVMVRDAERHLLSRGNPEYVDRQELVPISGPSIEFYENRGSQGLYRTKVNPQTYKVEVVENEKVGRLPRGVDEWDDRKRERIILWKKFANYMIAYGRDSDYPYEEVLARTSQERIPSGNVVTFYQRWGDVGCWAFCDGHYQFNFPDHTKIVISGDGTWCDFYHLSLEAARDLSESGVLSATALDDRQRLSYPLQTLLNFMAKPSKPIKSTTRKRPEIDPLIQGIPFANGFRQKVEFIRDVVKEWVTRGGLGKSDMTPNGRLRWGGSRETVNVKVPFKHVWCTVGASHGDQRRVGWFDPKTPMADLPDIQ